MMAFHTNAEDFYNKVSPAEFTVCFHMLNDKTGKYNEATTRFEAECVESALVRLVTNDFDLSNKITHIREHKKENVVLPSGPNFVEPEGNIPPPPPMPHPDDIT